MEPHRTPHYAAREGVDRAADAAGLVAPGGVTWFIARDARSPRAFVFWTGPIDAPRTRLYPTTMIRFHRNDLPADASFGEAVAIDTETLGLELGRDRLCVVQLSRGDGTADIVQIGAGQTSAPNLQRLLADPGIVKLFHFGRFDMGVLQHAFGTMAAPVYCTKIASKIARTYTDRHGLKDLTRELLGVEISKQQQSSDWGADTLSEAQLAYAASDVLHLHALREKLDAMLKREGRAGLAHAAFAYLPDRVRLDLAGFEAMDIFSHGYP